MSLPFVVCYWKVLVSEFLDNSIVEQVVFFRYNSGDYLKIKNTIIEKENKHNIEHFITCINCENAFG